MIKLPIKKLLPLLILPFVMLSCLTTPPFAPGENEPQIKKIADIDISVTLLTEADLKKRHGIDARFYYKYPALIPRHRVVVFEFKAHSLSEEIQIQTERVYIRSKEGSVYAQTLDSYKERWSRFITDEATADRFVRTMEKNLLKDKVTITPAHDVQGYLVFLTPDKRSTEWELIIPARSANGDRGNIVFDFALESLVSDNPEENNEGIFKTTE
jgi:hypothetical protein